VRKKLVLIAVSFSLTGCVAFDVVNLAFTVVGGAAQAIDPKMRLSAKHKIEPVVDQKVYAATFNVDSIGLKRIRHCEAQGVVVDYTHDWDVIDKETGVIIRKSDPNKIYDQAILAYKLSCDGEPEKTILNIDDRSGKLWYLKKLKLHEGEVFLATKNYFSISENSRPRWIGQVIRTIQEEAVINPAAQEFLAHVKIKDGMPISPEISKTESTGDERVESISVPDAN